MELLPAYPQDHEKFHHLKDLLSLYHNYGALHVMCYTCGKDGHVAKNCPKTNFDTQKNKQEFLDKLISENNRVAKDFTRRPRKDIQDIDKYAKMTEAANYFQKIIAKAKEFSSYNRGRKKYILKALEKRKQFWGSGIFSGSYLEERQSIRKETQENVLESTLEKQHTNVSNSFTEFVGETDYRTIQKEIMELLRVPDDKKTRILRMGSRTKKRTIKRTKRKKKI